MEIRAKCTFDRQALRALMHLTMFKKASPVKRLIFWSCCFAILFAVILLEMILFGADTVLLCLMGVELVGIGLIYFSYFAIPEIQYRSLAKMRETVNRYVFGEDDVRVYTSGQALQGESKLEYTLFVKAYETTKYLFLYQTGNQVYIVEKATLEGGTAEELRGKFLPYLENKYVICNY